MEATSQAESWDRFRHAMQAQVTPVTWQTWLEPLQVDSLDSESVRLLAPSEFHLRWINDRYRGVVERAATEVFGDIAVDLDASEAPAEIDWSEEDDGPPERYVVVDDDPTEELPLSPKYSFENFVVGPSNRFAHAAAMAIAEQPGGNYNPLFIYGGAGLGKTHLLQAVAHHAVALDPSRVVRYISSEDFFNEFIDGIRRKRMGEFKNRYRTADVLLLDDVQFLENKEQVLEEFFHTFNALHSAGKQLVFSADRPPRMLTSLEDRIRSRFEWGLTTDIVPPDVETRLAILRKNASLAPRPVPEVVLQFIAEQVSDNIRELEGALTRVTAYAALTEQTIDLDMAMDVLQDLIPDEGSRHVSTDEILTVTAASYGLTATDLRSRSRRQPLARARQIAMYLVRQLTDLSLPRIGEVFGGRDHTTVLHGINTVQRLMKEDQEMFDRVTALLQSLRTS